VRWSQAACSSCAGTAFLVLLAAAPTHSRSCRRRYRFAYDPRTHSFLNPPQWMRDGTVSSGQWAGCCLGFRSATEAKCGPARSSPYIGDISPGAMPPMIELFCGPGGLGLAVKLTQGETIWAGDKNASAVATYRRNFPQTRVRCMDLNEEKERALEDINAVLQKKGIQKTEDGWAVGLLGGPPCQGVSIQNNRAPLSDPRNDLFRSCYLG